MREEGRQPAGAEERQDGGQDGGGPEGQQDQGGEGQPRPLQAGLGRAAREAVAVAAAEGVVLLPGDVARGEGAPGPHRHGAPQPGSRALVVWVVRLIDCLPLLIQPLRGWKRRALLVSSGSSPGCRLYRLLGLSFFVLMHTV